MNSKISGRSLTVLVLGVILSFSNAYADGGCRKCGGHSWGGGDGLEQKFYMKAHFIMENSEALGLAQEKVDAIKALKMETKKALIRQEAEIDIAGIDLKSAIHNYPIDVEAANKLVDQKYELKKAKAKTVVAALARLKGELSQEQYDKLKSLWQGKESGHGK
jgi:hypothetical protein